MATGFNINAFKSNGLTLGGARPSLFDVFMTIPTSVQAAQGSDTKFRYTCQASELPASTVGTIEIPYFGRNIKLAGDRTFGDWTVTVQNDEDFLVRSMFEKWSNSINRLEANIRQPYNGAASESLYKCPGMFVNQYSKDGNVIRSYEIVGAFPSDIGAINVSWDSQNRIETFDVRFSYDYWLPLKELYNGYLGDAKTPVAS